jgi:hypothetical protein
VLLESYRQALHNDGIFESIWDDLILSISEFFWTSVSILDPPRSMGLAMHPWHYSYLESTHIAS